MARVLFISGSYPPEVCGVGDYTKRLLTELAPKEEVEVILFSKTDWSMSNFFRYRKEILNSLPDIVHMQYPTEGYGYSLLPFFLLFQLRAFKKVLTLHEFSNRTFKAKFFTLVLSLVVHKVIVTNDREKAALISWFRFLFFDVHVIGIGSNIPRSKFSDRNLEMRELDLVYFGHIRPEKGLERFLSVAAQINCRKVVIGQTLSNYLEYYLNIKEKYPSFTFILNECPENVALRLSNTKIVFLPFPDGVSTRRGSLMAAVENGAIVVSTPSKSSEINAFFSKFVFLVEDDRFAMNTILRILGNPAEFRQQYDFDLIFRENNWSYIANEHINLYSQLV